MMGKQNAWIITYLVRACVRLLLRDLNVWICDKLNRTFISATNCNAFVVLQRSQKHQYNIDKCTWKLPYSKYADHKSKKQQIVSHFRQSNKLHSNEIVWFRMQLRILQINKWIHVHSTGRLAILAFLFDKARATIFRSSPFHLHSLISVTVIRLHHFFIPNKSFLRQF